MIRIPMLSKRLQYKVIPQIQFSKKSRINDEFARSDGKIIDVPANDNSLVANDLSAPLERKLVLGVLTK